MTMTKIDIAEIDEFVSRNGHFAFLDWLLERNWLAYENYEAWRYGNAEFLLDAVKMTVEDIQELLRQTQKHCIALKLQSERAEYFPWGGNTGIALKLCAQTDIHRALSDRWISAKDLPQMDLFMDNSAAIAENQLIQALADRQFREARSHLTKLSELNSGHKKLGQYLDLVNYGEHMMQQPEIESEYVEDELMGLEGEVVPLASELLSAKKRDYLAFAWRRIASNMASFRFQSDMPKLHGSYALLQIPDWQGVQQLLEASSELSLHGELLFRLGEAYLHNHQVVESYWVWGILFEAFPELAEKFLGKTQHREIVQAWDDFLAFDDECPENAFLGYLLIRQPGLVHSAEAVLDKIKATIKLEYNQCVLNLLRTRIAEANEKSQRELLQQTCAPLLRCYLNKRDWYTSIRKGAR